MMAKNCGSIPLFVWANYSIGLGIMLHQGFLKRGSGDPKRSIVIVIVMWVVMVMITI